MPDGGPRARFICKLRCNIALEGDLLLARLELEAFFAGGVQPVAHLSPEVEGLQTFAGVRGFGAVSAYTRSAGLQGFAAEGPLALLPELVRRLAFVQQIYCLTPDTPQARALLAAAEAEIGPVLARHAEAGCLAVRALPHYALVELSEVAARRSRSAEAVPADLEALLEALLDRQRQRRGDALAETALAARSTTGHLSHDLHYYKAKFFPRMARALLNHCLAAPGGARSVLDPFAGSGTALLEAALLGVPSTGLDIDPLSVLIARAKLDAIDADPAVLAAEHVRITALLRSPSPGATPDTAAIHFPAWLLKNRRMTAAQAAALAAEIAAVRDATVAAEPCSRDLLRVLLSDAVARRIRMRFLGTGAGRFALTFSTAPVPQLFLRSLERYVRVAATSRWLRETLRLRPAAATIVQGDARRLPEQLSQSFDALVTSPPYLPASSGRESYARARAPSLIALGLHTPDGVDLLADGAVGSMDGAGETAALTEPERRLVEWLAADPLRAPKAAPTARYFLDMGAAFAGMRQVLAPGARAVVVSGKQSTYYRFADREPLYTVPVAELLAERARAAGFVVEALRDVQLQKSNRNARPRSLDAYYETLIMLRTP